MTYRWSWWCGRVARKALQQGTRQRPPHHRLAPATSSSADRVAGHHQPPHVPRRA